jgi:nitrogen-specific signal transduction histidine kinase
VEGFGRNQPIALPVTGDTEIGSLAAAFARMARDVGDSTAALREKTELFDRTIESMSDGILIIDAEGRTVFANATCKTLFGADLPVGESAYQTRHQRFYADGVTPMRPEDAPIARALRGERFDNVEIVFRRGDEPNLFYVIASGGILSGAFGKIDGAVIVYRNMTRFRETERQLYQAQKMEAVGQLTGGVAHDFNNILTVLAGGVEIICDGVQDRPQLAEVAKMLNDAVDRGADLTNQLLAFARKQPLQPRVIDINAMVMDSARLLRPTLGEQVEIDTRLVDKPWPALADPAQLSSALLNLAVNARDAMPAGGKLTLETDNVMLDEAYADQNAEVVPGPTR